MGDQKHTHTHTPLDFFRPKPSLSITSSAHRIRLEPAVADGARRRRINGVGMMEALERKSGDDCCAAMVVVIVAVGEKWVWAFEVTAVFDGRGIIV